MPQTDGTGRLSTFEAPKEGQPTAADQSGKDRQTVMMVEKLFSRYKSARMAYDKDWVENYKFFRGKQWEEARPAYRSKDVLNFTHAAVQTIIPIMTDSRPNIQTIPENPSDFEFSEIMTQMLTAKWDRANFSQIVAEAIVDACIYGTAISEQQWNPEDLDGLGDYEFKTVDPMYCYPDPRSREINDEEGTGFITAIPTDLAQVKREHPDKAHLLKADLSDIDQAKTAKMDMDDYRVRSATDNQTLVQGERPADADMPDQILVITAWLDDETMVEEAIMMKDETGKKVKKFRTRKKYPNGRKIKIANKVLLEDIENPYIDGKKPFAKMVDYILPREFWGEGEIDQLKGPQQIINKLWAHIMDVLSLMGNPVWKNPVNSGVFDESIVNKPGLVIPHNEGAAPMREPGMEVQASVFQAFDRARDNFDKISGIHDVSQGVVPAQTSGVAIDQLQEAAQTRIRLKARNMEAWLNDVGQQFASRILQFYSVPRIVRVTENENAATYFKVVIDEVTSESGEQTRVATVQNFEERVDEETGEMIVTPAEPQQFELKGNLDIRITVGTTLPFRKAQRKAQAKELFQLGIYDADDLLTDLDHPRKEQVIEKFNQRQQAEAEAQAAAEQQEAAFRQAELQMKAGAPPAASPQGPLQAVQP